MEYIFIKKTFLHLVKLVSSIKNKYNFFNELKIQFLHTFRKRCISAQIMITNLFNGDILHFPLYDYRV